MLCYSLFFLLWGWLGSGLGQQHRCTCTPTWCHHRRISPCGSTTTSCYVNIIWYHMPLLLLRQKNFFCTAGCFKLYRHFTWCYVRRPSLALPPQLEAAFFLIWPNSMHFHPTPLSPNSMHFQQPQRLTRIGTPKREKGPKGCNAGVVENHLHGRLLQGVWTRCWCQVKFQRHHKNTPKKWEFKDWKFH